ncbi:MAG: family ATPase [Alphaproteobacteria bacterium]|nr:family ATPase [Alphaproteobacteria bacterium]
MQCATCHTQNAAGRRFCAQCGAALAVSCESCDFQNSSSDRFCGGCGRPIQESAASTKSSLGLGSQIGSRLVTGPAATDGQIKLVTVLFADIRGSTAMIAGLDPEETMAKLEPAIRAMIETVKRYEGTVCQIMGDGILALFGAPVAHEDHAVRACYAALAMQRRIGELGEIGGAVRIGLNSGEVLTKVRNTDMGQEYNAIGDAVHLAARMEQMAEPGSVLMSAHTQALAEAYIDAESLGRHDVKGMPDPLEVFRLVGATSPRSRWHAASGQSLSDFTGRHIERQTLHAALEDVQRGGGRVVGLVGEAGIGKSRLIHELVSSELAQECTVLVGGAAPYGQTIAYNAIGGMIRHFFGIGESFTGAEVIKRVHGRLIALDPGMETLTRPLASMLVGGDIDSEWAALEPEARRRQILDACRKLVAFATIRRPLIAVLEDLHWIDGESEAVIEAMIESLPAMRLLLVLSYRPEYQPRWSGRAGCSQTRLLPLSNAETEEFLKRAMGSHVSLAPLKSMLADQTAGNPLFMEQCVRALAQEGVLVADDGGFVCNRAPERVQLPASVNSVLAARIDRLSPTCFTVLELAALIGALIPLNLLERVAQMRSEELQNALAEARHAEVLRVVNLYPDVEYAFGHALMRDAVLDSMLKRRQEAIHRRIVEAIEQSATVDEHIEQLALHATMGRAWVKASSYQEQAADRALAQGAYREASAHLSSALQALDNLEQTTETARRAIDAILKLRGIWAVLGVAHDTMLESLERAEQLAQSIGDEHRLAATWTYLSAQHWVAGDGTPALEFARRARLTAERLDDPRLLAMALFRVGLAQFMNGAFRDCLETLGKVCDILTGPLANERLGMSGLTSVFARNYMVAALSELGDFAAARRINTEATAFALESRDTYSIVATHIAMGYYATYQGDTQNAIPLLERALLLARSAQAAAVTVYIAGLLGRACTAAGRLDEAVEQLRFAVDRNHVGSQKTCLPHFWMGEVLVLQGRAEDALACLNEGRAMAQRASDDAGNAWAMRLEALIAGRQGRHQEAADKLTACLELARTLGMRPLQAHALFDRGLCRAAADDLGGREDIEAARQVFIGCDMANWAEKCAAAALTLGQQAAQ